MSSSERCMCAHVLLQTAVFKHRWCTAIGTELAGIDTGVETRIQGISTSALAEWIVQH